MFNNVRKMLKLGARKKSYVTRDGRRYLGGGGSIPTALSFYKGKTYDNAYPNITKIANAFMTIRPFAIDGNGKPVENVSALNAIYRPNQQMSAVDFREALMVMTLVHRKVYLAVWHYENGEAVIGKGATADNLAGFTFLEGVSEVVSSGAKKYLTAGATYDEAEVIEIYSGFDPYNLSRGYSPSVAANKWANLDDYIAAYEAGLFENGAVPAGQFIITAATIEDFNKQVDEMERRHRGSGRNNNVIYTHRPISDETGLPVEAQIQWIPFAQSNKDMNLESLFDQANKKLDSAYGVPDEIKGFLKNSNYASVAVAERVFLTYTVDPLALKIWTRFTFELNRITGGLGYAITYKIDIPNLADEDKVRAETRNIEGGIIRDMIAAGFSIDSIVDAFQLSNSYKLLRLETKPTAPVINNDKPEVDDGGEVDSAPDSIDNPSEKVALPTKSHQCEHKHKSANPEDQGVVDDVAEVVRKYMQKQIDVAIEGEASKSAGDTEESDITLMVAEIMAVLTAYMLSKGQISYEQGLALLEANGIAINNTSRFVVNELTKAQYLVYLTNVARSYSDDTAASIRSVLARGQYEGWDKETLARSLRDIMNTDEWRVQRMARTEEHRCVGQSSVNAMQQLMHETGAKIYKVWHTNGAGCEFCQAMNGKKELVTNSFLVRGDKLEGADGGMFLNDFADIDSANMHPNCGCYIQYEVAS